MNELITCIASGRNQRFSGIVNLTSERYKEYNIEEQPDSVREPSETTTAEVNREGPEDGSDVEEM